MAIKDRPDPPEVVQARQERLDYLAKKLRASVTKKWAYVDRLRAEGILPPEDPEAPPRRF
jgi:hypothetical protein